jgi:hypothetical protein
MTAQPFKTIVLDLLQQSHLDEVAFLQELDETERTAIGTAELWSAKDHMAHRTFWHTAPGQRSFTPHDLQRVCEVG